MLVNAGIISWKRCLTRRGYILFQHKIKVPHILSLQCSHNFAKKSTSLLSTSQCIDSKRWLESNDVLLCNTRTFHSLQQLKSSNPSISSSLQIFHNHLYLKHTNHPFWSHNNFNIVNYLWACSLHTTPLYEEEEKSVMEKAVTSLKERKQQKVIDRLVDPTSKSEEIPKPPLLTRIKNASLHYYHGFRLFGLEVKIASRLFLKTLRGQSLSRREQKQFRRTVGDVFRILPFSIFIIIPFMELLLPVYLWFFPNALPSTFQTKSSKDARKKKELKVKIQMAKFLQDTVEEMSVTSRNPNKVEAVKEFAKFFEKIRTTGAQASTEEIIKFSKVFEDELTLSNLSHKQLQALCRLVLLPTIGSSAFLRFQLKMKMQQLEADDKMIQKEGVHSLTAAELQAASQARGMRALGMPIERLKSQLQQWLDLHLNKKISVSFLLLSRALYLPEDVPTPEVLKATLSTLPENIVDEAEVMVASTTGEVVDNRRRVDIIKQQEILIREEQREKMEREREKLEKEMKKEGQFTMAYATSKIENKEPPFIMVPLNYQSGDVESFSAEEIRELNQVVSSLKGTLEIDKEALREIKEDREEYCEDMADLAQECAEGEEQLAESVASQRLGRRVEAMLDTINKTLGDIEQEYIPDDTGNNSVDQIEKLPGGVITVEQLEKALMALRGTSVEAKYRSLFSVLDEDHDGNIKLEEVAEIIETLAKEDTDISPEHIAQIKHLIKLER